MNPFDFLALQGPGSSDSNPKIRWFRKEGSSFQILRRNRVSETVPARTVVRANLLGESPRDFPVVRVSRGWIAEGGTVPSASAVSAAYYGVPPTLRAVSFEAEGFLEEVLQFRATHPVSGARVANEGGMYRDFYAEMLREGYPRKHLANAGRFHNLLRYDPDCRPFDSNLGYRIAETFFRVFYGTNPLTLRQRRAAALASGTRLEYRFGNGPWYSAERGEGTGETGDSSLNSPHSAV